jgi:hypothetical protein
MTPATSPVILQKLVNSTLEGKSTRQIETELGIDHSTVAKALQRPIARQMLEKAYLDMVNLAPHVVGTFTSEIKASPEITDYRGRKLRVEVADKISAMIGLSPVRDSHNNVFFTNIIAPTAVSLSPIVEKLLARLSSSERDEESIDVEYREE